MNEIKLMLIMESAPGARVIINNQEKDYFCGCGYLGFQSHPELIKAACEAVSTYGTGSATSRSGYGNNPVLLQVEENAAHFFGTESALYYASGYLGNAILLQTLRDDYTLIFVDKESHFSVLDGIACARKPMVTFAHLNAADLKQKMKEHLKPSDIPLVICDGVFPISGAISPVDEYVKILNDYPGGILCVDDAHAIGVLGLGGRGSFEYLGLSGDNFFFSGTLSKALGGIGGVIPGGFSFIEKLKKKSSIPYASSAPSTPAAAASARAFEILASHPELRLQLQEKVAYAKKGLRSLGFEIPDTPVPIICLNSREGLDWKRLQEELFEKGIAVLYAPDGSYSGVPTGGAIRIAIFATHTLKQIDRLIEAIKDFIAKTG